MYLVCMCVFIRCTLTLIIKQQKQQMKAEEEYINIDDDQQPMQVEIAPQIAIPSGNTAFDLQFQLSAQALKEEPHAKSQLLKRLNKFFEYNKYIEPGKEHFRPRLQQNFQADSVPNVLILFGSDFKKFKKLKQQFNTNEVKRINDSNCKLVFGSFEDAWNAILSNAKEPSTIALKRQSEELIIPKCWFEMKPYTHLERIIDVQVRFATTEDLQIQPEKEDLIYSYKDSKDIFNNQEMRLREEEKLILELKREKLQVRKQINSENLYNQYQSQNRKEWNTGKNNNPGAHREEKSKSRSRSRSRDKKARRDQLNDDVASNYSYAMGKELKEISKQMNKVTLGQQPREEMLDLSFDLSGAKKGESAYNWKGSEGASSSSGKFNYREYVQMKEKEQAQKRKKIVPVIVID